MKQIFTHRSSDNAILKKKFSEQIEQQINVDWKSVWYKRVWFYFFEQEIRSDVAQTLEENTIFTPNHLLDPEYQALVARCSQGRTASYETWDEVTVLINDYIFLQGKFFDIAYEQADETLITILISLLAQGSCPRQLHRDGIMMSDVLFALRRARADVAIASQIQDGKHSYQTLLKVCGEYMGTFACVPRFVQNSTTGRSMATIISVIDTPALLDVILEPNYSLECATLAAVEVIPYGYVTIQDTPYATWISKLGYLWSSSHWYVKIGTSLAIIFVSVWLGGPTLIILPIIWGILALARTAYQYLSILQSLLSRRYTSYSSQYDEYTKLYDVMVDPDKNTNDTLQAQGLMTRWFDVIPFSGHELMWEATDYAKKLYQSLLSFSTDTETRKQIAMMDAVAQWSDDHHLSLVVVKDGHYVQQALYRFYALVSEAKKLFPEDETYAQEFAEQYESIDELISGKKYKFWLWSFRNALRDGIVVTVSSGLLGWMGSYLWNRTVGGSSALAASPSLLVPVVSHPDVLLSSSELLEHMERVMPTSDIEKFLEVINTKPSATLWDTMVDTFGFTQGNVYTNHLMDTRWRISDDQTTSELFSSALHSEFPVGPEDASWGKMINFLHRTYDYDNLAHYSRLLSESWLPDTLQGIQSGTLSLSEFAALSLEQREIITQALFYHLDGDSLQQLFDMQIVSPEIILPDLIIPSTGSQDSTGEIFTGTTIDTGTVVESGTLPSSDLPEIKDSLWQEWKNWKEIIASNWAERFPLSPLDRFFKWEASIDRSWLEYISLPTWSEFTTWKESIDTSWMEKFSWPEFGRPELPSEHITGSIDLPDLTITGSLELPETGTGNTLTSGSLAEPGFWSEFRVWLKGTPPEKVIDSTTGSLVDTGVVDTILSGLNSEELMGSGTIIDHNALAPGQIPEFTLPVIKKDKSYG